ncbi:MAG: hypothetical protein E6J68_04945 [Deltaproteobacteria bacterium]|nr:MAG: hypothetical protein E6J68_04945 [Deltaproteobacteria bacterium]TMA70776.1 MAG: hypothetical protein E6J69_01455 [Deltaproteobacteria bacterium]
MNGAPGSSLVLRFLDALRAAEAAGAAVVDAWVAVCPLPSLRGGLRTIAEREAGHAALLEERLRELGGTCDAAVPEAMRAAAVARFGSSEVPDEEKLGLVLARYPEEGTVRRPIAHVLELLDPDLETRELLRLVAEGEGATVAWLRAYHASLRG